MKLLSLLIAVFSILTLGIATQSSDVSVYLLGFASLGCALTTWRSQKLSSFLKIFVGIFGVEVIAFGCAFLVNKTGYWPPALKDYLLPDPLPLTVAIFSILVYLASFISVVRTITSIADPYFASIDMRDIRIWPFGQMHLRESHVAKAMIAFLVVINQAQVGMSVRLSFFSRDWFNAIQKKDEAAFWSLLLTVWSFWVTIIVFSNIVEYIIQSRFEIRWRRWLTAQYVGNWLGQNTHYRMSITETGADNPDQRIAADINMFIGQTYGYSITLLSTVTSLVSFSIILWDISSNFTIPWTDTVLPGFLFWIALIYSLVGTLITHLIGRALVRLNFDQQKYEANFRFSLARLREYSEQVALLRGDKAEESMVGRKFGAVMDNFLRIVDRRKRLMIFTSVYGQLSPIIPYIISAPFYFAGKVELGVMSQTAGAFGRVEGALTFFINYYVSLADYKAVLDRLSSFDSAMDNARNLGAAPPRIASEEHDRRDLLIQNLSLHLPNGRLLLPNLDLQFSANDKILVTGPSGSGKSTLFRAIAGIWPYGNGQIVKPADAHLMLLPQKPYIPIASLREAITYPSLADSYDDEAIRKALIAAHLPDLVAHLNEVDNWSQRLSGGEQQRLAIARALLARPNWLFLDEATAALDESTEAAIYQTLAEHLPQTTIISIGHRSSLMAFHNSKIELRRA
jgi:putative ATP-binding cassette transporter